MERQTGISWPLNGMGSGGADGSSKDREPDNLERIRRNLRAGFYDTHVVILETARRMLRDPDVRQGLQMP